MVSNINSFVNDQCFLNCCFCAQNFILEIQRLSWYICGQFYFQKNDQVDGKKRTQFHPIYSTFDPWLFYLEPYQIFSLYHFGLMTLNFDRSCSTLRHWMIFSMICLPAHACLFLLVFFVKLPHLFDQYLTYYSSIQTSWPWVYQTTCSKQFE